MKKQKPRTDRIANPFARRRSIPCRFNENELAHIKNMADRYAGGNVSLYIRDAVINYLPSAGKKLI